MARQKKQNKQAPKPNFALINRSIFDWEWWGDIYVTYFFIGLILLANHEDKMVRGIKVKRGQCLTSVSKLESFLLLNHNCILNCIKKLKSSGEILDDVKPNKYRIITIVNYDKFQGSVIRSTDNRTDTVKKETLPSAVSPEGEPPTAFDYEKIDWHIIQTFEGDEGKDLVYGNIPYKSVGRFSRANGIDDYTASEFHTAFERSKTPFPRNWQKILVKYNKLNCREQDEFIKRLHSGEFREKWAE